MPVDHYENFPVASFLLPAHLRPAVKSIYRFARSADDIADEGSAPDAERLAGLARYGSNLDAIEQEVQPELPLFRDLSGVIREHALPVQPFRDLLSAFSQDVTTRRYACFADLMDYCNRSAAPVGRIMLHLYRAAGSDNLRDSDAICSALQLINFWQDVGIDWQKGRVYLPQDDLVRFGVSEEMLAGSVTDDRWRGLMRFQAGRAREMMLSGAPLALRLPGRIGWELRLVVQGGLRILERIEAVEFDVFRRRPTISRADALPMLWRAVRMGTAGRRHYRTSG